MKRHFVIICIVFFVVVLIGSFSRADEMKVITFLPSPDGTFKTGTFKDQINVSVVSYEPILDIDAPDCFIVDDNGLSYFSADDEIQKICINGSWQPVGSGLLQGEVLGIAPNEYPNVTLLDSFYDPSIALTLFPIAIADVPVPESFPAIAPSPIATQSSFFAIAEFPTANELSPKACELLPIAVA